MSEGGQGRAKALDSENFSKNSCFLSFEWEKTNFTTFDLPLENFWKNPLVPPPLEKSFRRPCRHINLRDKVLC